MEIQDVRKLLDIPEIEDYLQNRFVLELYEVGDRTIIYKCILPNRHSIVIDMISDESLIIGSLDLAEIIAHYKIAFLHFVLINDLGNTITSYMYRPCIGDEEKDFIE